MTSSSGMQIGWGMKLIFLTFVCTSLQLWSRRVRIKTTGLSLKGLFSSLGLNRLSEILIISKTPCIRKRKEGSLSLVLKTK